MTMNFCSHVDSFVRLVSVIFKTFDLKLDGPISYGPYLTLICYVRFLKSPSESKKKINAVQGFGFADSESRIVKYDMFDGFSGDLDRP